MLSLNFQFFFLSILETEIFFHRKKTFCIPQDNFNSASGLTNLSLSPHVYQTPVDPSISDGKMYKLNWNVQSHQLL